MAEITFDEQQTVLKALMEMKFYLERCNLPDKILIERATESISLLNKMFDEGDI